MSETTEIWKVFYIHEDASDDLHLLTMNKERTFLEESHAIEFAKTQVRKGKPSYWQPSVQRYVKRTVTKEFWQADGPSRWVSP